MSFAGFPARVGVSPIPAVALVNHGGGQSWKSDAVMGTTAGRWFGMRGPARTSISSGSLKRGSIWKARQASSLSRSELAAMVWCG